MEPVSDEQQRLYHTFLSVHHATARPTAEPAVHLQFYGPNNTSSELLLLDRDDVLEALDPESPLVRWLLRQLDTYECTRQVVLALSFPCEAGGRPKVVLSDVLRQRV